MDIKDNSQNSCINKIDEEKNAVDNSKKKSVISIIALLLTIFPISQFFISYTNGNDLIDNGWRDILFLFALNPLIFVAFILALISYIKNKDNLAKIILFLTFLPILIGIFFRVIFVIS